MGEHSRERPAEVQPRRLRTWEGRSHLQAVGRRDHGRPGPAPRGSRLAARRAVWAQGCSPRGEAQPPAGPPRLEQHSQEQPPGEHPAGDAAASWPLLGRPEPVQGKATHFFILFLNSDHRISTGSGSSTALVEGGVDWSCPRRGWGGERCGETREVVARRPAMGRTPRTAVAIFPERHRPLPAATAQEKASAPP